MKNLRSCVAACISFGVASVLFACPQSLVAFPADSGACTAGRACSTNPGSPCRTGKTACSTGGVESCENSDNAPAGTSCGTNQVCDGTATCVACVAGMSCAMNAGQPCAAGTLECAGGPRCVDGARADAGTPCGLNKVCSNAGSCVDCQSGSACTTNPGAPCFSGQIECSSGAPVCVDVSAAASGTTCDGGVCVSGVCTACVNGASCSTNAGASCFHGKMSCGASITCNDDAPVDAGTDCDTGQVCNGSGSCVACARNATCAPNSNVCKTGVVQCDTGASVCAETGNVDAGASCGVDQVCTGDGGCIACAQNAACAPAGNVCKRGLLECGTGAPVCAEVANVDAGASCGTNLVCTGDGGCISCLANVPCFTNTTVCMRGSTSCQTGTQTCADTSVPKDGGVSCGTDLVCNGSGGCIPCTQGASCRPTSNPCHVGTMQCGTGTPVCVDTNVNAAVGTHCGGPRVCAAGAVCGLPTSCAQLRNATLDAGSGVYSLDSDYGGSSPPFTAYCDMTSDDGGWTLYTVIRGRFDYPDWSAAQTSNAGVPSVASNALGRKPAGTQDRTRIEGNGWHLDMRSSTAKGAWQLDPCVEDAMASDVLVDWRGFSGDAGVPTALYVNNNHSGCGGIGMVAMDYNRAASMFIKGVQPVADRRWEYLAIFGEYLVGGPQWYGAPPSTDGGFKTHCPTGANDVFYRCSGFLDEPNWTGIYKFYR